MKIFLPFTIVRWAGLPTVSSSGIHLSLYDPEKIGQIMQNLFLFKKKFSLNLA